MPLKYWRTMLCALALGLIGLVVWADDRIRGTSHREQPARTEPQAAASPPAQIILPTAEPSGQSLPSLNQPVLNEQNFDIKPANEPILNERNYDVKPATEPVETKRGFNITGPIVTTPVAPPVVPPPPAIEIVVGKAEPPLAQAPELEVPVKAAGATEIVPAPASPALPEPPPPIPQAPKPDMKPDPLSAPPAKPPSPPIEPPLPPPPLPAAQAPLPPPAPISPKALPEEKGPALPLAPPAQSDLPPLPTGTSVPSSQPLTPPPAAPMAKLSASAAPFRLHLHMGGAQIHRFEIRDGDKILLKVYCDKVELHGAQDGSSALPGLTASGHVRLHGAGLDGTCEQLTVASADGKVTLKGGVHMTCYRGTNSSQVTAEHMSFQLNRAGETPVNTKARGSSSTVTPASFSNWTDSKFP